MKETRYRVKMTGCRVKIKGFGRVEKKGSKGWEKRNLEGEKKRFRGWGKKGSPLIFMDCMDIFHSWSMFSYL